MKTFVLADEVPQVVHEAGFPGLYAIAGEHVSGDTIRLFLSEHPANYFMSVGPEGQARDLCWLDTGDTLSVVSLDGGAEVKLALAWLGDGLV